VVIRGAEKKKKIEKAFLIKGEVDRRMINARWII
jgi:hypothetical protein